WGSSDENNDFDAVIDLGGEFLALPCDSKNASTTYCSIHCGSTKCRLTKSGNINCRANDTSTACTVSFLNPFDKSVLSGRLTEDSFSAVPSDGDRYSRDSYVNTSHLLPFACLHSSSLKGLARGYMAINYGIPTGIIGFGATKMSFVENLASALDATSTKFAICLPATDVNEGVIFVGGGSYLFDPYRSSPTKQEASEWLHYTPLIINPSGEYFIGVKSIKIDKRLVRFGTSLLSLNQKIGVGGTKISTSTPYTVLHTSIYKAVVDEFVTSAAATNITRVAAVAPFGACFSTKNLNSTKAGPSVPMIDLELEPLAGINSSSATSARSSIVKWRIIGANSMVNVKKNVTCLGFLDGGSKPTTSIIIGGLQLEDNLLEFDLKTSRLGFTSSFWPRGTSCSTDRLSQPDN
ncbi:Aspartic peptidase, partial [Trema orientale]